jgi:HK97 family phage major capsid protein
MNVGGLVLVMTSAQAMRLSLMRNSLGQKEFMDITLNGGTLEGIPVITSENIVSMGGSPTDGYPIVAINAPEILLADDGGVEVDISREASLQMNDSPDSPETTSTILVSLWQRNMVAIRAERFITWKARRSGAVQYISYGKYA